MESDKLIELKVPKELYDLIVLRAKQENLSIPQLVHKVLESTKE